MAEFEPLFTVRDAEEFVAGRVAKVQRKAESDPFVLAKFAMAFYLATARCRCNLHSCGGCKITGAVHVKLCELIETAGLDPRGVDYVQGRLQALWDREELEQRTKLRDISRRADLLSGRRREPTEEEIRAESIREAEREAAQ